MKRITNFFNSRSFWLASTLILIGVVLTLFGEHNELISAVFLDNHGRFQWAVLAGITAVYSFIYSIYLNSHKEKVDIVLKPEIERDQMLSDLLSEYLALSTQLATDVNNSIGNQLYRYHDAGVKANANKLEERIQNNYPKFQQIREKLLLEIKPSADSQPVISGIDDLHTHVEACLRYYNRCLSKLDRIESSRQQSSVIPPEHAKELMADPEHPNVFISRTVRDMFNNDFKPERVNTYHERKELRRLASEYLDANMAARRKMFDF